MPQLHPAHLAQRAATELGETPQKVQEGLAFLRNAIPKMQAKIGYVFPRTDDTFLLNFLRHSKFRNEKARKTMKAYARFHIQNHDFFDGMTVEESAATWGGGTLSSALHILPHAGVDGSHILCMQIGQLAGKQITKESMMKTGRANVFLVEKLLEDPATSVCGISVVEDMAGMGLKEMVSMQMQAMDIRKRLVQMWQGVYPLRMRGIYILNEPTWIDVVFAIVRPFLKKKLIDRCRFLGADLSKVHDLIDRDKLPAFLGGDPTPQPKIWEIWMEEEQMRRGGMRLVDGAMIGTIDD